MTTLFRLLRILVFALLAVFLIGNAALYALFSSSAIQSLLVKRLNTTIFAPMQSSLELERVSLGLFPPAIHVQGASLTRQISPELCKNRVCSAKISFKRIRADFDLGSSYRHLQTAISKVNMEDGAVRFDWDDQGNLILPLVLTGSSETAKKSSEKSPMETYLLIRKFLPESIQISTLKFALSDTSAAAVAPSSIVSARIRLDRFNFNKTNGKILDALALSINKGKISLKPSDKPATSATLTERKISSIAASGVLGEDGVFLLGDASLQSTWAELKARGKIRLGNQRRIPDATLKINGTADVRSAMELFAIPATGRVTFDLTVRTSPPNRLPPLSGKVSWPDGTSIDGFSLHQGQAELSVTKEKTTVKNVLLRTDNGGSISASGSVTVGSKKVNIQATATVQHLSFITLMKGLDIETNAVEFFVDSPAIEVAVDVGKSKPDFLLRVSGPIALQGLKVPSLHTSSRTPLPNCRGFLSLISDSSHLDLTNTSLHCRPDDSDKTIVKKGEVSYKTGKTLFVLDGKNIDVAHAEYFLMDAPQFFKTSPTTGSVDLIGEISSDSSASPVLFKSHIEGRDVRLYGVDYVTLSGDWGIDREKIWGKNLEGKLGKDNSKINLATFAVNFDDEVTSSFDGTLEGNLTDIFLALHTMLPRDSGPLPKGNIERAIIKVAGPFSPRKRKTETPITDQTLEALLMASSREGVSAVLGWDSSIDLSLSQPSWKQAAADRLRLQINCQHQECTKSRLVWERLSKNVTSSEAAHGGLILDVSKFSLTEVAAAARFQNLSIKNSFPGTHEGNPVINGRVDLQGPWKSLRAFADLSTEDLMFSGKRIEPIHTVLTASGSSIIELKIDAQSDQIQARFQIPQKASGATRGYINFRNADLTALLPRDLVRDYAANLKTSGEVLLDGNLFPSTPTDVASSEPPSPWYRSWSASGKVSAASATFKRFKLELTRPAEFRLAQGQLTLDSLLIQNSGDSSERLLMLDLSGGYNLTTRALSANSDLSIDLGVLPLVFQQLGSSHGVLSAKLKIFGIAPSISIMGEGKINNGTVLVQALPPAFRDIDLVFKFNDKSLEIESLKAKKGEGTIDANGTLNWEDIANNQDTLPKLSFDFNLDRFQTRIPIPALQAIDVEMDGRVQVCSRHDCGSDGEGATVGNSKSDPLLISAQLTAQDARVTRGLDCVSVFDALVDSNPSDSEATNSALFERIALDVELEANQSISIDTKCAKTRMSIEKLLLSGRLSNPRLMGKIETADSSGSGELGNIRFNIENGSLEFDGRPDNPRYDILLSTSVSGYRVDKQRIDYKIYIHLDDRPLNKRRKQPEIRAEPPTHPDGQRPLSQTDLVAMILTGRGPDASSPVGFSTEFVANEFATAGTNAIFSETRLQSSVSRMFNRLSAGIVDRVVIDPIFDAGRPKFRIRTIMAPVENVNVNVETDQDPSGTENTARNAALTSQWILNNSINLGLDLRVQEVPVGTPLSMGTGITFQFGGE